VGNTKVFSNTVMNYSARLSQRVERVAQLAGSVGSRDAIARFETAIAQIANVFDQPGARSQPAGHQHFGTVIAVQPHCHTDCSPARQRDYRFSTISCLNRS